MATAATAQRGGGPSTQAGRGPAGRKSSSQSAGAASDDENQGSDGGEEEEWDESLPKPRPGETGVTKRTLQNREFPPTS